MVSVRILDILVEEKSGRHMVLLSDDTDRILPVFVGATEASGIAAGIKKGPFPRPMTYDTFASLLKEAEVAVESVVIDSLRSAVFLATIHIKTAAGPKQVDARPSDALALAVRMGAQIGVSEDVLQDAAISLSGTGKSAGTTEAVMKAISERMKALSSAKGWRLPDLPDDLQDIKIRSLLSQG